MQKHTTLYLIAVCLLLLSQLTHAFDFKSLIFGDSAEGDDSQPSTSVTFGTPIPEETRSSRSGKFY